MTRSIAAAGAFVVSLDSMVNIAFPAIATAFALPPEAMRWVIMCYVFTYAVLSFVGVAFAIGPIVAGALLKSIGWRAVFGARLPVAVAVLAWAWRGLPRIAMAAGYRKFAIGELARV